MITFGSKVDSRKNALYSFKNGIRSRSDSLIIKSDPDRVHKITTHIGIAELEHLSRCYFRSETGKKDFVPIATLISYWGLLWNRYNPRISKIMNEPKITFGTVLSISAEKTHYKCIRQIQVTVADKAKIVLGLNSSNAAPRVDEWFFCSCRQKSLFKKMKAPAWGQSAQNAERQLLKLKTLLSRSCKLAYRCRKSLCLWEKSNEWKLTESGIPNIGNGSQPCQMWCTRAMWCFSHTTVLQKLPRCAILQRKDHKHSSSNAL